MKQFLAFALKAAISLLLLYLALRGVDFAMLRQRLGNIDPAWSCAAILMLTLQVVLVSLRWQQIAAVCGAPLRARDAILFAFIGMFFNQTLPSTVGGDAARVWLLARAGGGWKNATYSVLIDRAVGLVWLALIVLVCLPWSLRLIQNPVGRITLGLIGAGGIAGPAVLYAATHAARDLLVRWRVTRHLTELARNLWRALVSFNPGGALGAVSVAVHLMTVVIAWMIAKAIGAPLDLFYSLLLIPPVILISAIPISIAGWGVREGAMVAAFTYAGLPESDGLTISVLFGAGLFLIGAIGGIIWIVSGRRVSLKPPAEDATPV